MKTRWTAAFVLLVVTAMALSLWVSSASAGPLTRGSVGPSGAGLRLLAMGAGGPTLFDAERSGLHTCAVIADGSVRCWGANGFGQLGNGSITGSSVPVTVTLSSGALTGVTSVAAGRGHTCAVRVDSTVVCWGDNRSGQLGIANNLKSSSSTALQVVADASRAAFTGVVMVAAGAEHTCALLFDGTIRCWGDNTAGQATGRVGTENVATPFPLLTAVPSFTFNVEEAAALGSHGRVATVTALGLCEAGAQVQIRVELIQGAVSGHGITAGRCTGALERYEVTVPAQGRAGFVAGPATAVADAIVRDRGQVVDQPHWTRAVELAP